MKNTFYRLCTKHFQAHPPPSPPSLLTAVPPPPTVPDPVLTPVCRFKCRRCVNNIQVKGPPEGSDCNADLSQWSHSSDKKGLSDLTLKGVWNAAISFVFHHWSHEEQRKTV